MNLGKSVFYTFGALGGIIVGATAIILGFRNDLTMGFICGAPALLVGLVFLVLAYRHINIDYDS